MRGARYGFPGWVTETTQKNGKTKYGYLEKPQAEQRANDYLRGATKPGEIAGRQLALLAMATYADQNAVAVSSRSWHQIKASGPWAIEADELLDKLVADNLPDGALALLAPVLEKRKAEQAGTVSGPQGARGGRVTAGGHRGPRIGELTVEELDQAERDLDAVWARWTPEHTRLRDQLASPSRGARRARQAGRRDRAGLGRAVARCSPRCGSRRAGPAWHAIRACGPRPDRPRTERSHHHKEWVMPAGITSNDSMFSVRETPWHGLGAVLDQAPNDHRRGDRALRTQLARRTRANRDRPRRRRHRQRLVAAALRSRSPAGGPTSAKTPAKSSGSSASATGSSRTSRPSSSSTS